LSKDRYRDYFSRDLLYHLWSNLIVIPPLRDRAGDIRLFAEHFLKRVAKAAGKTITGIDPELIGFLESYEFPGNESELRDAIATAVLRENGETLKVESLSRYVQDKIHTGVSASTVFVLRKLDEVVRESVQETVRHLDGDIPRAALELDVSEGEVRGFVE
jgi:DNA-binding NtrC family response regulator